MHEENNRILVVDDAASIHEDFEKILNPGRTASSGLDEMLEDVFGEAENQPAKLAAARLHAIELSHAYQGEEAIERVDMAAETGNPFAVAFVDVRMPPGLDGIETVARIWQKNPHIEVVICTAYSDYSWEKIVAQLGTTDQLQFLRKPVDVVSVKQMALALTRKWNLARRARHYMQDLEREVAVRTEQLAKKIRELEAAAGEIKQLQGILPMCVYCHKVRDDDNYWQKVDRYISNHTLADISHGICPECYEQHVVPMFKEFSNQEPSNNRGEKDG